MTARSLSVPRQTNVRQISPAAGLDAYLRTIAGRAPGPRLLEIRFRLSHGDMGRVFLAANNPLGAGRFIRRLAPQTDVYVGAALRTRAAGGRDAIEGSHLTFVEIDTVDALSKLAKFAHPPTMILTSGTPGHAHAYWTLPTPVAVTELERANRMLAHHLGGDLASTDAARILRPPATWNHKRSPPAPVELVDLDPTRRYVVTALTEGLVDPSGVSPGGPTEEPRSGRNKIDRALLAISATEYAQRLVGCTLNRAGKIPCPFHEDRTPSLQLYEDGTWYCYGACQTGGSIYDFGSRLWGIGTKGASFLELRDRLAHELSLAR